MRRAKSATDDGVGLDMIEHLLGPVATVMAQMTGLTYGDGSTVALALGLENRAVATMLGSHDSSCAYPDATSSR